MVQNYPELHLKMALVLNLSSNSSSEAAHNLPKPVAHHSPSEQVAHSPSQPVAEQQGSKNSDESLLSDKAMDALARDMRE